MARPPLPIGTYGKIRVTEHKGGGFTARAGFRDYDGVTRDVERNGPTRTAAENALKSALRDRAKLVGSGELKPDSKVSDLADLWWASWQREKGHSPNTEYAYRLKLDNHILPGLGSLRLRELTTARADRFLRDVEDHAGSPTAKMTRSVLSNMCGYACRHEAMTHNPVREVGTISVMAKPATALTIPQVKQLLSYLSYDPKAIARDLLDFVAFLAATGVRHGEALGLRWDAIDFEAGTFAVSYQVIRIANVGLVLKAPKSQTSVRILELPRWALSMLELRQLAAPRVRDYPTVRVLQADGKTVVEERLTAQTAMVFPSTRTGTYGPRDPRNVHRMVDEAYRFAGLDITNHKFRKTVLTEMDEAGLSARAAADQAGHAKTSMTQDRYMARKLVRTGAAEVLERIGDLWS